MRRKYKIYDAKLWIIGSLTVAFAIVLICRMISPTICDFAIANLQSEFNKICNRAVIEYIDDELKSNDIVLIDRNDKGEIRGITTDTILVNKMKSEISLIIQKNLDKIEEIEVKIPINAIFNFGGDIKIPVQVMGVGVMETELLSNFESVGVNQTRLTVDAVVHIKGKLLAVGQGYDISIKSDVPVLMTVIVGSVPNTYVDVKK